MVIHEDLPAGGGAGIQVGLNVIGLDSLERIEKEKAAKLAQESDQQFHDEL